MDLASRFADIQFVHRRTDASIKAHRAQLDELLAIYGRKPRDLGCLWSVRIQAGETDEEARAKEWNMLAQLPPDAGLVELSFFYGIDFSNFRGDMRLADTAEMVRAQQVHWGTFQELMKTEDHNITIEELGRKFIAERTLHIIGKPKKIADRLEEIHDAGGRNGGIILAKNFAAPGTIRDFVELVVPELQHRGLTKRKYAGPTLRENLVN
jgi:long-chain alkane monooxygenase